VIPRTCDCPLPATQNLGWRFVESPIGAFTAASVLGDKKVNPMRGVVLWLLGVPISVIILLYLFNVL
jgi:hypothetical protein